MDSLKNSENDFSMKVEKFGYAWSSTAMEFLPHTQHVAHFYCQCSPIGNQYRGSLSQILSDPLSTIPLLHLVNANVTILVELNNCHKLKLSLDVTELLLQRSMSSSNIDFVLKVSFSKVDVICSIPYSRHY